MVKLIGMTIIDWGNYVRLVEKHTNKYPTKMIDELGIKTGTPEAFLQSLKSLNENALPRHLYYTFIGSLDHGTLLELVLINSGLDITLNRDLMNEDKFFILSGDIDKLVNLLVTYTTRNVRKNLRIFLNQIFLILEGLGFKEIFSNYRKSPLDDNTFILERKN